MRKETPSTDVGRVLIIGELRRKHYNTEGDGLLQLSSFHTVQTFIGYLPSCGSEGLGEKKQSETKY